MRNHHQNSKLVVYIQGIYITRAKSTIQMLIFIENHAEIDLAAVRKGTPKRYILHDFWGVWEPTNSPRLQVIVDIKGNQLSQRNAIVRELVGGQKGRPDS